MLRNAVPEYLFFPESRKSQGSVDAMERRRIRPLLIFPISQPELHPIYRPTAHPPINWLLQPAPPACCMPVLRHLEPLPQFPLILCILVPKTSPGERGGRTRKSIESITAYALPFGVRLRINAIETIEFLTLLLPLGSAGRPMVFIEPGRVFQGLLIHIQHKIILIGRPAHG